MTGSGWKKGPYEISTNVARVDVEAVHAYLTQSYWAAGIPRDVVAKAVAGSLCFSLFDAGAQVGRFLLVTRDAHGLYARFSFKPVANQAGYLEILQPDIYKLGAS